MIQTSEGSGFRFPGTGRLPAIVMVQLAAEHPHKPPNRLQSQQRITIRYSISGAPSITDNRISARPSSAAPARPRPRNRPDGASGRTSGISRYRSRRPTASSRVSASGATSSGSEA